MKVQFTYRKIDRNEKKALGEVVREGRDLLAGILGDLDGDATLLEGAIEKNRNRKLYRVRLKLVLPGRTLTALEEAHEGPGALREAFAELRRQAERHKHLARNDHLWKRPRRRAELRNLLKESAGQDDRERRRLYLELIRPHLDDLYALIRHELAYHQALGDLLPSEIGADEVLDAAIVRGFESFEERPAHLEVLPWLTRLALDVISEEIQAHQVRERRIATEARPPEEPMEVSEEEDTEYYEFHQPDEVIRLEDLIPDPESPLPEEAAAIRERNRLVHEVLALLPKRWRHVLVLMDLHGLSASVAAEVVGVESGQLEQMRACAESFMREWLTQRIGPDEIEDATTRELLATPLREPLPDELEAEILEKFMPME